MSSDFGPSDDLVSGELDDPFSPPPLPRSDAGLGFLYYCTRVGCTRVWRDDRSSRGEMISLCGRRPGARVTAPCDVVPSFPGWDVPSNTLVRILAWHVGVLLLTWRWHGTALVVKWPMPKIYLIRATYMSSDKYRMFFDTNLILMDPIIIHEMEV